MTAAAVRLCVLPQAELASASHLLRAAFLGQRPTRGGGSRVPVAGHQHRRWAAAQDSRHWPKSETSRCSRTTRPAAVRPPKPLTLTAESDKSEASEPAPACSHSFRELHRTTRKMTKQPRARCTPSHCRGPISGKHLRPSARLQLSVRHRSPPSNAAPSASIYIHCTCQSLRDLTRLHDCAPCSGED